ncbi:MAG TPA: DUF1697 domain-containing protein [Povalibacter sp.]|uniref:DUF1697 domain-containing protein n=1 Tax=Povalibacter sp. TaxID=1962978 RepID=UPI002CFFBB3B|nr:DUF1697 domain-containing protein [Povalibacter sp.]HMN46590.1 DUF1697 domain-containing protein [Povalibacter sp.]
MTRYVAFLRGVSPMNCRMPQLKRCFEAAGFTEVKTLLSSGNVAFSARSTSVAALEKKARKAMQKHLDRVFQTIVRPAAHLQSLIDADPFAEFDLPKNAKRVVTFLPRPYEGSITLPVSRDQASILKLEGAEVFSVYVPNEKGPVFMALLERTFGAAITTRTFDTVRKCAVA